jgi:serine/threonine protein kinase
MSPQILAKSKFSAKCDVWSLGMTFYEMLYGKTPWSGVNIQGLLENILTKKLEFPPSPVRSEKVKELLTKMLAIEEEDRISWNDIFLHELVGGSESKEIKKKLQEVQGSELEDLEKSFTMNQIYISNNKVLDQGHHMEGL